MTTLAALCHLVLVPVKLSESLHLGLQLDQSLFKNALEVLGDFFVDREHLLSAADHCEEPNSLLRLDAVRILVVMIMAMMLMVLVRMTERVATFVSVTSTAMPGTIVLTEAVLTIVLEHFSAGSTIRRLGHADGKAGLRSNLNTTAISRL